MKELICAACSKNVGNPKDFTPEVLLETDEMVIIDKCTRCQAKHEEWLNQPNKNRRKLIKSATQLFEGIYKLSLPQPILNQ